MAQLLGAGVFSNAGASAGFRTNTLKVNFELTPDELKDFSLIHASVAKEALKEENAQGDLLHHNRFVDGKQWKVEEQVKFGGKIVYDDIYSLTEVMRYIDAQVRSLMPVSYPDGGKLQFSHGWYLNGNAIKFGSNVQFKDKDRLICMAFIRYAKYQEVGTVNNQAQWMYKKARARAARRFGRGFIFEHKMIESGEIKSGQMTKKLMNKKKNINKDDFYKERWANVYPGIRVKLRKNVIYK